MPKIIENLRERLIEEARRQTMELGYPAMTIRSVAGALGVGTGTVYNYFKSKDELVAAFMLGDWMACLERIRAVAQTGVAAVIDAIYTELTAYHGRYQNLFLSASTNMPAPPKQYHVILRGQIAQILRPFCQKEMKEMSSDTEIRLDKPGNPADFTADFAAEALLVWTMEQVPLEILRDHVLRVMG